MSEPVIKVRKNKRKKVDSTDIALLVGSGTDASFYTWDRMKIVDALLKEASCDKDLAETIAIAVEQTILKSGVGEVSSGMIRELVNNELFIRGKQDTLKQQNFYGIPKADIEAFIYSKSSDNSNVSENNPEALSMFISGVILQAYALDNIYSTDVADAHRRGVLHVHDNSMPQRLYCGSHSVAAILKNGLKLRCMPNTSSPAKTAQVLIGHMVTASATIGQFYSGAIGFADVNTILAPLLVGLSDKEVKQLAQYLFFSMAQCAFSRGGQVLFTDLNLNCGVSDYLKNVPAISIGGKPTGKVYGDYAKEARRFTMAALDVMREGDSNGAIMPFPKGQLHIGESVFSDPDAYAVFEHACHVAAYNGNVAFAFDRSAVQISQCCFSGNQLVAFRNPGEYQYYTAPFMEVERYAKDVENIEVLKGSPFVFAPAKLVKLPGKDKRMFLVLTEIPEYSMIITSDHLVPVNMRLDVKKAYELTSSDSIVVENVNGVRLVRILSITEVPSQDYVYCFEMKNSEYPYFQLANGVITHNCRLRENVTDQELINNPDRLRFTGLCNTTINLPQCGYRSKRDKTSLWEEIDAAMQLAIKGTLQRKDYLGKLLVTDGSPLRQMGRTFYDGKPYVDIDKCTLIIGMNGLNELVKQQIGRELHEGDDATEFGLRVISRMYFNVKEAADKYGLKFVLEQSPAESASERMAKCDLRYFPESSNYINGNSRSPYYTNSIHLRADADVDIVERIRIESKYHTMIEGGSVVHAFVGENKPSAGAIASLVHKTFENTECSQLTISPEFTLCAQCGSMSTGLKDSCPKCGAHNISAKHIPLTPEASSAAIVAKFEELEKALNSIEK